MQGITPERQTPPSSSRVAPDSIADQAVEIPQDQDDAASAVNSDGDAASRAPEQRRACLELRHHLPILVGASYKIYKSGEFVISGSFRVGASYWKAAWVDIAGAGSSRSGVVIDAGSSFTPVIMGSVDLGFKLGDLVRLRSSVGYASLGSPNLNYSSNSGATQAKLKPVHSFTLMIGLEAVF